MSHFEQNNIPIIACKGLSKSYHPGLVQHEIRIFRTLATVHARFAMIGIAPFIEQIRTEARTLDRFQELLGNDRIGIDIGAIQRADQPVEQIKFFHLLEPR